MQLSSDAFVYVGFWKRFVAQLLNFVIFSPLMVGSHYLRRIMFEQRLAWPLLLFFFVVICFDAFLIVKFGGDPGKRILKFRIADRQGQNLTVTAALLRLSPVIFIIIWTFCLDWNLLRNLPADFAMPTHYFQRAKALAPYRKAYTLWTNVIVILWVFDYLFIAFNRKKRAVHDFLAGSFVVKDQN